MAKEKKTIIFIVEGSSDKAALENIFKKIYRRNKEIDFGFTNGDITSDPTVTIANVENRIYETVQEVIKDKKLKNRMLYKLFKYLIWMEHIFQIPLS